MSNDGSSHQRRSWLLGGAGVLIVVGIAAALMFQKPENEGVDPKGCELPKGTARAVAFIELEDKVEPRDTVVEARVCLRTRDPKVRIGSYHGLITWDSTKAKLVEVEKGRMGMRLENTTKPGVVDFAGAFPAGFDDRAALTLELKLTRAGKLPPLTLHMYELNEVNGTVLTSMLTVTGYPRTLKTVPGPLKKDTGSVARSGKPTLKADSVKKPTSSGGTPKAPTAAKGIQLFSLAPGEAGTGSEVVIRGQGFTATANTVRIGPMEIKDLPAADGGTLIRFTIPRRMRSTSEVPPMVIAPGKYEIVVHNERGTSNTLLLVVKD